MRVKVQWIIDGLIEIDAESNEAAEAIADEKLRSFIAANPESVSYTHLTLPTILRV